MIAYLKGKVIDIFDGGVVLENGGIGYELLCTSALFGKLTANKEGGAYTYLQVREDGLSLFGFDTKEEKGTFLKLIAVSGVGPKMAMGILSGMSVGDLATAIATNDIKSLSKVKGLGKKTAERIILELRESVSKGDLVVSSDVGGMVAANAFTPEDEDAMAVLVSLGFSSVQCRKAISDAKNSGAKTIQEIISGALQIMGK